MKILTIILVSVCLIISTSISAVDSADDPAEKRSIGEFVLPDGRIDLEAVRISGYQGPLDLEGLDVRMDPRTGESLVQVSASKGSSADSNDIYWDNSISPSIPGVDGIVHALAIYDSNLIVAGEFTIAGGVSANYIASWDGTFWSALGTGMNDWVLALTVYNNQLIAGGEFTTAGDAAATYIASWDGTSWSAMGTGMGGTTIPYVYALTVYDSQLIAGGNFITAGGMTANYIASWDGTSWSALGTGMNRFVLALTVNNTPTPQLIVGGSFMTAGGVTANRIASWNGTSWSALGLGFQGGGRRRYCPHCL